MGGGPEGLSKTRSADTRAEKVSGGASVRLCAGTVVAPITAKVVVMVSEVHRVSDPEAPDDALVEADDDLAVIAVPTSALRDPEVPEADALEQARDLPYDDEYGE